MGEQLRMRAPAHYLRVDLSDPAEREYWLVVLDAGRAELEHAVACAGPELWNVRDWLRMQRRAAPACETDAGPQGARAQ